MPISVFTRRSVAVATVVGTVVGAAFVILAGELWELALPAGVGLTLPSELLHRGLDALALALSVDLIRRVGRISPTCRLGVRTGRVVTCREVDDDRSMVHSPSPTPLRPSIGIPDSIQRRICRLTAWFGMEGGHDIGFADGGVAINVDESVGHLVGIA